MTHVMTWRRSTAVPHVLSQPPSPSSTPLHTPHGQDGCGGGRWWRVTRLRSCVHRRRSLPLLPTVTVAFLNTTPCPSRAVRRWKWLVVACDTVVVACGTATKLARRWNPVHRRRSLPLLPQSSPLPLYTSLSVRSARCSPRYRCRSSLLPRAPPLSTHTPSCLGGLMPWAYRPQRLLPTQYRSSCGPAARAGHASAVLITVALRLSHCRRHCTTRVAVLLPHSTPHPLAVKACGDASSPCDAFSARPLYTPSRRVERRSR